SWPPPGRHSWGTWDGDRLAARVMGREYHSWWHGRQVPTCGIAGVAVAAEHRGSGLLDDLMAAVLDQGLRERGEVLSTLYPTAPGIYRRYGYEVVTSLLEVELATARLARVAADPGVTLRRATAADADDVRRVYATWAASHNGPLTRTGPSFPADDGELLASFTAVTLAVVTEAVDGFAAGDVVGFAGWHRGTGYDDSATITVDDLVSLHAGATRSLWAMLGSHASVTGRVRLSTSGDDPVRFALPFVEWTVTRQVPYMLRVHDVAGALTGLRLGPLEARVGFAVEGDLLGTSNGRWLLTTADGVSTCVPAAAASVSAGPEDGHAVPVLAPRGLALLTSGAQSCSDIRAAGLMSGDLSSDATLDTLFGGRRVHVRDYF
ncbi:GNAT family N-acetyltransferase, partial [Nocardioides sp. P5_C9_2]